ncbi:uncharacterized protein K452DRAFT_358501 [Aplosporella prunicola CBS 121167]|uniref:Myb-like domain-containing protein n=1 Tax=Aplosporella prunicola CBS 121167 TaxID=1176127 RepID=A0A6A6BDA2_9PEZI|nr:uncharacterized protein K452DRAFT_358501 [Aplosporella prunicola CBS 121167]KAF2142026.1 hypothetical protein K452DRAFT_358501 [Aplosporella prunicola CBS 121167]
MTSSDWNGLFSMGVDAVSDNTIASNSLTDCSNTTAQQQDLSLWDIPLSKYEGYYDATSNCYPVGPGDQVTPQNLPIAPQSSGSTMNTTDDGSFASWPQTTFQDMAMSSMQPFADPTLHYADHNPFGFNSAGQHQHQTQTHSALPLSTLPPVPATNGLPVYDLDCANNGKQGKDETDISLVIPHELHDPYWNFFNPVNDNNSVSLPTYTVSQTHSSEGYQTSQLSNSMLCQSNYNNYPIPEPLPDWPTMNTYNGLTSPSASESASPMSTAVMLDAKTSFGAHSFAGSMDSNSTPLPALTYSQGSPTDLEDSPRTSQHEDHNQQQGQQGSSNDQANIGLSLEPERHRVLRNNRVDVGNHKSSTGRTRLSRINSAPSTWRLVPTKTSAYYTTHRRKNPKDALLVEWKNAGLSYKQIRERASFTEAESTLRGRYRNLTKARDQRVRKPLWLAEDIRLLKEGLKFYMAGSIFPRADPTQINVEDLNIDASKVPWKKIAEYIASNGGSYHFGNATCKKQWLKIQGVL